MNPEEQTVTWLISLGVLSSPKKNIADPEEFLKTSLKDGVVLCKLTERLIPGFTPKEMSDNGGGGQMVKARFNFKQNNEDELSFSKGDMILVTRQEEGGWWEGTLNGKTGWFPSNYVREIKPCDSATLCGNLEEILTFQQALCVALEDCTKVSEGQQRVAGCYLNLMCQIKTLYLAYCSSHPSAVCILTNHSDELDKFMESQGASTPGILTLTTSLSKPFMRLDKYPHPAAGAGETCGAHPDYADIVKATAAFRNLVCQDLRKRKNLELQILSEPVRAWEGDSMKSLGHVAYMSQEKEERYLMLFPNMLVMLSASPRMSGFIYQGRLPLTGTTVTRHVEEADLAHYAFDITVLKSPPQKSPSWALHCVILQAVEGKSLSMVGTPTHLSHLGSLSAVSRGPLEPPKISKPWSLSCLRPAPPLKPSAALGYKEDSSKSPRPMKKFLQGNRKKERKPSDDEVQTRKSTAALEEDAQILRVIEAYCTGASLHQTTAAVRKDCVPQVLLPEEEKIIVEEMKSNGQTVIEEKSLVDAVYALKDEVHELKKENKWMKQFLEEEQKSRKELERVVRKLAKQKNDCAWDDGGH
ncbi:Rho guanine nucleotide exchange factor 6 [Collichthys lucidus]|uniref:Rho guanine nucleotide exchange factor 6 n=1 Tax=Collichthys lucidus TaxID=240159 RepID=A0A4U5UDW4_COLLU|nr:Rho guanine nucleotide exchange factor 6 [Collichthys lucidus]